MAPVLLVDPDNCGAVFGGLEFDARLFRDYVPPQRRCMLSCVSLNIKKTTTKKKHMKKVKRCEKKAVIPSERGMR